MALAAGSSALNQVQERVRDSKMPRTAKRPLPSGKLRLSSAIIFLGLALSVGFATLWYLSTPLLWLGVAAVVSYNGLYTMWWKNHWAYAAIPGAIPGALPILMGYAASSGEVWSPGGLFMFAVLFFWQMPHFWVLAIRYAPDYEAGGVPTLPVAQGPQVTVRQIEIWCLGYVALALGGSVFLRLGSVYHAISIATSVWLLRELYIYSRQPTNERWLRFFLSVNATLLLYTGGVVADLWSIHLIEWIKV
jgi:protoheme IX farnesyltransferase